MSHLLLQRKACLFSYGIIPTNDLRMVEVSMMINKGQEPGTCINLLLKSEFNRKAISASLFPLKEVMYPALKDPMTTTQRDFSYFLVHKEIRDLV